MKFSRILLSSLIGFALSPGFAIAAGMADQISVGDPYVRQAPPGAMATGAFMTIRNSGKQEVRIVSASNPASAVTELHTHLNEGGVMKMRQVKDILVPAGGEAVLKPGGLHVMLIDMKGPLSAGDTVPITLKLEDGSSKEIGAIVRNPASSLKPASDMAGHKH